MDTPLIQYYGFLGTSRGRNSSGVSKNEQKSLSSGRKPSIRPKSQAGKSHHSPKVRIWRYNRALGGGWVSQHSDSEFRCASFRAPPPNSPAASDPHCFRNSRSWQPPRPVFLLLADWSVPVSRIVQATLNTGDHLCCHTRSDHTNHDCFLQSPCSHCSGLLDAVRMIQVIRRPRISPTAALRQPPWHHPVTVLQAACQGLQVPPRDPARIWPAECPQEDLRECPAWVHLTISPRANRWPA